MNTYTTAVKENFIGALTGGAVAFFFGNKLIPVGGLTGKVLLTIAGVAAGVFVQKNVFKKSGSDAKAKIIVKQQDATK